MLPEAPSAVLSRVGVDYTPTSLTLPADFSYDEYEDLMRFFGALHGFSRWAIGDALIWGELAFRDDRYLQAAVLTGLSEGALMNYASTARRVPPKQRNENVSFSSHMEVAALEPDEQRRWLDAAEGNRWTKAELRARIQARNMNGRVEIPTCECCGKPLG